MCRFMKSNNVHNLNHITTFLKGNEAYLAEASSLVVMNFNMKGQFDSCILMGNKIIPEIRKSKK